MAINAAFYCVIEHQDNLEYLKCQHAYNFLIYHESLYLYYSFTSYHWSKAFHTNYIMLFYFCVIPKIQSM